MRSGILSIWVSRNLNSSTADNSDDRMTQHHETTILLPFNTIRGAHKQAHAHAHMRDIAWCTKPVHRAECCSCISRLSCRRIHSKNLAWTKWFVTHFRYILIPQFPKKKVSRTNVPTFIFPLKLWCKQRMTAPNVRHISKCCIVECCWMISTRHQHSFRKAIDKESNRNKSRTQNWKAASIQLAKKKQKWNDADWVIDRVCSPKRHAIRSLCNVHFYALWYPKWRIRKTDEFREKRMLFGLKNAI